MAKAKSIGRERYAFDRAAAKALAVEAVGGLYVDDQSFFELALPWLASDVGRPAS